MDPFQEGFRAGALNAAQEIASLKERVATLELKDMPLYPLHPLHTRKWIESFLDHGYQIDEIRSRRTGRSTVQALTYITEAISNPGKRIEVSDHFGTPDATDHLLMMMRVMVSSLRLEHIYFNRGERSIIFENRNRGNE